MQRTIGLVLTLLLAVTALPAQAQHPRHHHMMHDDSTSGPGMMMGRMGGTQGMPMMRGMHRQMMQSPMHRAGMTAFMLPHMADTLDLSSEQVATLQSLKSALQERHHAHQQAMKSARQDLRALFDNDADPAPSAVRDRLRTLSDLRTAWQAAVYETAHAMRETLTDQQRERVDGMTPDQHMDQVMTHMSKREAMHMMNALHRGMMSGMGMMDGGKNDMPGMHHREDR